MIQVTDRLPSEHEYGRIRQLSIQNLPAGTLDQVDERLTEAFAQCPQLELVALSGVPDITDRAIVILAHKATKLQGLDLSNCVLVSDVGILEIAARCIDLQWLQLAGLVGLTDPSISAVAKSCPRLEEIDVCGLPLITPSPVRDLWSFSKYVSSLRPGTTLRLTHSQETTIPSPGTLSLAYRQGIPSFSEDSSSVSTARGKSLTGQIHGDVDGGSHTPSTSAHGRLSTHVRPVPLLKSH